LAYASNTTSSGRRAALAREVSSMRSALNTPIVTPQIRCARLDNPQAFDPTRVPSHEFEKIAKLNPDKPAVMFKNDSGDIKTLTYDELNTKANQLARVLKDDFGISRPSTVAIGVEKSANTVISMLALWKLGCAYVPIDTRWPLHRAETILNDAGVVCSIIDNNQYFDQLDSQKINLESISISGLQEQKDPNNLEIDIQPNDTAYVIYTSGTTGKPKGVQIDHCQVPNIALDQKVSGEVSEKDRVLFYSSFSFDASVRDIVGCLLNSATLYIPTKDELLASNITDTLNRAKITYTVMTPSVLKNAPYSSLPDLRKIVLAGEAADRALIREWGKNRVLFNAYGPTEASVCCAKKVYKDGKVDGNISIGKPTANMTIYIAEQGKKKFLGEGAWGEIVIGGHGVSNKGYIGLPEKNHTQFVALPDGTRGYRSGDIGQIVDGEIYCKGRIDSQVKINGQRIELGEISSKAMEVGGVKNALSTVVNFGDKKTIVTLVQKSPESDLDDILLSLSVKKYINNNVPAYMNTAKVIAVGSFPTTTNGKIDNEAISALYHKSLACGHNQVLTSAESRLIKIIANLCNLDGDYTFSPMSTLSDLGMNSLSILGLKLAIFKEFGRDLDLLKLMGSDISLSELAQLIYSHEHDNHIDNSRLEYDFTHELAIADSIEIAPVTISGEHKTNPKTIFLTGATGFLGSHMLANLLNRTDATIHCLVRATDTKKGMERVQRKLKEMNLLKPELDVSRVKIHVGQLNQERLGLNKTSYDDLAKNAHLLVHCAAEVNFIKSYEQLYGANVQGTMELLKLAGHEINKPIINVSSLSSFFNPTIADSGDEKSLGVHSKNIIGGYAQTKWVSENLGLIAKGKGLDVKTIRPARISGHSEKGISPMDDFNFILFKFILSSGVYPLIDYRIDLTPVDYVVDQISGLSSNYSGEGDDIFHIINPESIEFSKAVELLSKHCNKSLKAIPYEEWKKQLDEGLFAGLQSESILKDLFVDNNGGTSFFDKLLSVNAFRNSSFVSSLWADQKAIPGYDKLMSIYSRQILNE
jgi:amino acid adenylation domain-containing protein/thioester reductase-like protein